MRGDTKIRLADGSAISIEDIYKSRKEVEVQCLNDVTGEIITAPGTDPRISGVTHELRYFKFSDGSSLYCTGGHMLLDSEGEFVAAEKIPEGAFLSGGQRVMQVGFIKLDAPIEVYDLTVEKYQNFVLENGVIVHNSGKSFAAKRELLNVFLATQDRILIVDPMGEYSPLVRRLGGQVVTIAPNSNHHINPMDISDFGAEDENPMALKSDFILSLCELIVGGKDGLQPVERTVIDRCVRLLYRDFIANPATAKMPVLHDLHKLLVDQPEPEAQRLATALEIYVSGSLNVFNHQTNVDLNNRVVCLDLKQLGSGLRTIAMLIMQDFVWSQVSANFRQGVATWCYFDEFHILLQDELTASYCVTIWKMLRKKFCMPSALTQNVKDFLSSPEIENILENSDFYVLLSQAAGDREILAKHLGISPHQLSYVTHSNSGEGLLFFGNVTIPFIDRFPQNTEIYKLLTTRPEDVANEA